MRTDIERLRDFAARLLGCLNAVSAGSAVGISRINDQSVNLPTRKTEMFTINNQWRGDNLIACEHGCGGSAFRRKGEGEIRLAAGFDAGGSGGKEEAFGKFHFSRELTRMNAKGKRQIHHGDTEARRKTKVRERSNKSDMQVRDSEESEI